MRLELRNNGSIVIREVTADAIAYINDERHRADSEHEHWIFSRNYEGTVYITATPYEDKTQLYEMIEELIAHYSLIVPDNLKPTLYTLRRDSFLLKKLQTMGEEADALKGRMSALKRVLREGCERCENFCHDGDCGLCKADGGVLNETPLSFKNGRYDKSGVWHMGSKFYPHNNCKFLTEELA